jgi:hypothetical protein
MAGAQQLERGGTTDAGRRSRDENGSGDVSIVSGQVAEHQRCHRDHDAAHGEREKV